MFHEGVIFFSGGVVGGPGSEQLLTVARFIIEHKAGGTH
jgi:hypothetical protein